jgi:hypothetical protein
LLQALRPARHWVPVRALMPAMTEATPLRSAISLSRLCSSMFCPGEIGRLWMRPILLLPAR